MEGPWRQAGWAGGTRLSRGLTLWESSGRAEGGGRDHDPSWGGGQCGCRRLPEPSRPLPGPALLQHGHALLTTRSQLTDMAEGQEPGGG